mgnify:CR=1 FL=1
MNPYRFAVPDQWKDRHAERIAIMMESPKIDLETATAEADREIAALVKRVEKEKFMKTLRDLDAKYAKRSAQWDKP